jgi:hypothetical protein
MILLGLTLKAEAQSNHMWAPGQFSWPNYAPSCASCFVQVVEMRAPHAATPIGTANPSCSPKDVVGFTDVIRFRLAERIDKESSGNLMPVLRREFTGLQALALGGNFGGFLNENGALYGSCVPLLAAIPASATVVAIHLTAWDSAVGEAPCGAIPSECGIGWSRFMFGPELMPATGTSFQTMYTVFNNWAHDRDRIARLFISYRMPPGVTPVALQ